MDASGVEGAHASASIASAEAQRNVVGPRVISAPTHTEPALQKQETRMIITRMIMQNFKSYAGRQEIGPFHKVRGIVDLP
jgi:hypothetical protein